MALCSQEESVAQMKIDSYTSAIMCRDTCDEKHDLCYSAKRTAAYQKVSSAFSDMENKPSPAVPGLEGSDGSGNSSHLQDTYSKSGIACLTGEEIGNSIQNLDEIESEDREADPCWQVKWHLGKLIKKMMSKSYEENISAINDLLPRRGIGHKINWESSRKTHSFLYNVELRNGELVIPQTGFYYIYSQIYFRFRENENEDSDVLGQIRNPKQLVQYIYRLTNYPEPILLMKSARTSCWSKKAEYGLYSTYQGGVFQLKREDRIFVSVSNSDLVDMDKEASFFGAFMIG
ncbi:Tumor necrosis factor ligand superfamily member 10 [Pitangus sulphuratus]|nr:Tumor necrosis factor ligand superfamily member 10 [Pitangus sulphuratus]